MAVSKKTVLITGCSEGGMGAALAVAFQQAGYHVYATARDVSKMADLSKAGIQTLPLDIMSAQSIAACVAQVHSLDILVNNAGLSYSMPMSDVDIDEARKIFDLNVFAQIAVTQAFLPLLLKSKGMLVNQTSVVGCVVGPFQAIYNASKAAMSMISDCQRLELEPFGVKVIDLKTGAIKTNLSQNQAQLTTMTIPKGSIYEPAREAVESAMRHDSMADVGTPADQWAKEVVGDLMKKNPPLIIWRGANARMGRFGTIMPHGMLDSTIKKMTGLDVVEQKIKA
jgi:short-subunit dehydrogenase